MTDKYEIIRVLQNDDHIERAQQKAINMIGLTITADSLLRCWLDRSDRDNSEEKKNENKIEAVKYGDPTFICQNSTINDLYGVEFRTK